MEIDPMFSIPASGPNASFMRVFLALVKTFDVMEVIVNDSQNIVFD